MEEALEQVVSIMEKENESAELEEVEIDGTTTQIVRVTSLPSGFELGQTHGTQPTTVVFTMADGVTVQRFSAPTIHHGSIIGTLRPMDGTLGKVQLLTTKNTNIAVTQAQQITPIPISIKLPTPSEFNPTRYLPPKSVVTVYSPGCSIIRCSVTTEQEWLRWFEEFRQRSNTSWLSRSSKPNSSYYVFSKNYVCKHSSYRKIESSKKGTNCKAAVTVRIRHNNKYTRCRDQHAKEGRFGVIKFLHQHNHTITPTVFVPGPTVEEPKQQQQRIVAKPKGDIGVLLNKFKELDKAFGSTVEGLSKALGRLNGVNTKAQWENFLMQGFRLVRPKKGPVKRGPGIMSMGKGPGNKPAPKGTGKKIVGPARPVIVSLPKKRPLYNNQVKLG